MDDIFNRIYEQYYRLMYQVAYGILQNKEDTEDALQESFIRIEKNISKISNPFCSKTRNFVAIITKRIALNILEKRKGNEIGEILSTQIDERIDASPEKISEGKMVREMVKSAIYDLPDRYRECLYLYLLDGYTPGEIAEILGMKEQSIYKRLSQGKKMLRERLAERGVTYED